MSHSTISVVLVTYKRPTGLDRTLKSIFEQTRQPDELIVCDDASGSETEAVVIKWKQRLPGLIYQKNEINLGMPGNLNLGIRMAKGDLIVNLHDADRYYPKLLEKTEEVMLANPNVGMVFWPCDKWANVNRGIDTVTPGREFFLKHYYLQTSSKIWGTTMVRKKVYEQLLPFDQRFKAWSDVDMWMRICLNWDIAYIPEALMELFDEEGQFRKWYWEKTLLIQQMFFLNIHRHFDFDKAQRSAALKKQLSVQQKLWWRFLLARIKHKEWDLLKQSLSFYRPYNKLPDLHEFESAR